MPQTPIPSTKPSLALIALASAVLAAAPAFAQPVNTDQLLRLIQGETIPERAAGEEEPEFTDDFLVEDCTFTTRGSNPFFSLEPCYQLVLAGVDEGVNVELFITVLDEIKEIKIILDGRLRRIRTRVIEEREFMDGELFEISRNYYARCKETNNIFYFGESVCFYKDGECVDTHGSWQAGVNGAMPGIIMPGSFLLGARYFQEVAPGVALDRAEHIAMSQTITVPAGTFNDCVTVEESSPLDPGGAGEKTYAEDIGFITDGTLHLISYGFDKKCGKD